MPEINLCKRHRSRSLRVGILNKIHHRRRFPLCLPQLCKRKQDNKTNSHAMQFETSVHPSLRESVYIVRILSQICVLTPRGSAVIWPHPGLLPKSPEAIQPLFDSSRFIPISLFIFLISGIPSSPIFLIIVLKADHTPHISFRPHFLTAFSTHNLSPQSTRIAGRISILPIAVITNLSTVPTWATSVCLANAYANVANPLLAELAIWVCRKFSMRTGATMTDITSGCIWRWSIWVSRWVGGGALLAKTSSGRQG